MPARSGRQAVVRPASAGPALAAGRRPREDRRGRRRPGRRRPVADRLDDARALVAEHHRPRAHPLALDDVQVGAADADGVDAHERVARPGPLEVDRAHDERGARRLEERRAHPHRRPMPAAVRAPWRSPPDGAISHSHVERVADRRVVPLVADRRRAVAGDDHAVAHVRRLPRRALDREVRPGAREDQRVDRHRAQHDVGLGAGERARALLLDHEVAVLRLEAGHELHAARAGVEALGRRAGRGTSGSCRRAAARPCPCGGGCGAPACRSCGAAASSVLMFSTTFCLAACSGAPESLEAPSVGDDVAVHVEHHQDGALRVDRFEVSHLSLLSSSWACGARRPSCAACAPSRRCR